MAGKVNVHLNENDFLFLNELASGKHEYRFFNNKYNTIISFITGTLFNLGVY